MDKMPPKRYNLMAEAVMRYFRVDCDDWIDFGASKDASRYFKGHNGKHWFNEGLLLNWKMFYYEQPAKAFNAPSGGTFRADTVFEGKEGPVTMRDVRVNGKLPVKCPYHQDTKPSAFIDYSKGGKGMLYCTSCQKTWFEQ
jgi:hypothetical protein